MKIALVQCPSWTTESPPYTLGLLSAILRKAGHTVECHDFNIKTFNYCKSHTSRKDRINGDSWCMDHRGNIWYEEAPVTEFINNHKGFIGSLIDNLLSAQPDIIGFSTQSTSRFFSLKIASLVKEKDKSKFIIFGGPLVFPNCYGSDILKDNCFLDAISLAEADESFLEFIKVFRPGKVPVSVPGFAVQNTERDIIVGDQAMPVSDLDKLPFADYSGFNFGDYTKQLIPITTSRGCVNRCTFCSESPHWRRYRRRSAANILNEIKYQLDLYPQIDKFWFNDSLVNGDIKMLEELCGLIISAKIKIEWGGQAMIRPEMTPALLNKMYSAGCRVISYGIESGSSRILKLMRKPYTAELAEQVVKNTFEASINAIFNIITGFPGEDEMSFQESKDFIRRCRKYASHIELPVYLLLKGSYIFSHLEEFGIAPINFTEDWQLKWKTLDNSNTYELRIERLRQLQCMTA